MFDSDTLSTAMQEFLNRKFLSHFFKCSFIYRTCTFPLQLLLYIPTARPCETNVQFIGLTFLPHPPLKKEITCPLTLQQWMQLYVPLLHSVLQRSHESTAVGKRWDCHSCTMGICLVTATITVLCQMLPADCMWGCFWNRNMTATNWNIHHIHSASANEEEKEKESDCGKVELGSARDGEEEGV